MSKYVTITPTLGAEEATGNITIDTGNGSGKIYICNKDAVIKDRVNNSLAQSTLKSDNMYLDNTGPIITLGNISTTTSSINIPYVLNDENVGTISSYTCKYGTTNGVYNTNASTVSTTSCKLGTNLNAGTVYYYQICATDTLGNENCINDYWGTAKTVSTSTTLASCSSSTPYTSGNYTGTIQLSSSTPHYSGWSQDSYEKVESCSKINSSTCTSCTSYTTCTYHEIRCGEYRKGSSYQKFPCTATTIDNTCTVNSNTSYYTCSGTTQTYYSRDITKPYYDKYTYKRTLNNYTCNYSGTIYYSK
ncbi:MAG: hypothetical protein NC096_05700 [Candidatus Amulumruptor caecigallinarius]|nr:hypothetical protein [Candidatus Amulumruptor caecigallinarius]